MANDNTDRSNTSANDVTATEEQLIYANILDWGMRVGLASLVVTFTIYVFGLMPPHIPLDQVSQYWGLKTGDFLQQANVQTGWSWVHRLGHGDFVNFIGVAFLAGITIICYLPIIPIFLKKKDTVYASIAVAEVLVLVLAASGILHVGGH